MKPWEIARNKRRITSELLTARNEIIAIAYRGVGSGQTLAEIAKNLNKVQLKSQAKAIKDMRNQALYFSKKCKATLPKKTEEEDADIIFPLVWRYFERNKVAQTMKQRVIYPTAQRYEEEQKKAYIKTIMETPFEMGEGAIFFLCSQHDDCADDHLDYQGKLYVDKHWRSKVAKKEDKARIQAFISEHQIKSMQWVISRPVWMITRPNCRHYFQPIGVEEALTNGVNTLIQKYDMHHAVGQRGSMQTIRHSINKGWYTKGNVLSTINQYLDRLRLHKEMYEAQPTQDLAGQIRKDRLLVERWRRYLKVNFQ